MDDLQDFATRAAAISGQDQESAAVINIAADVVAYHQRLLDSGMPKILIGQLTLRAAEFMWRRMVGDFDCELE